MKNNYKLAVYIVAGFLLLYGIIYISTRQPKMPAELKATMDSLTTINKSLIKRQEQVDSTVAAYQTSINRLDTLVRGIKEKTTIVREYYHEVGVATSNYTPTQVDAFFKARYNY